MNVLDYAVPLTFLGKRVKINVLVHLLYPGKKDQLNILVSTVFNYRYFRLQIV